MIKKYFSYAKISYKSSGYYLLNYLMDLFGTFIILVSFYYLWKSVYGKEIDVIQGFTLDDMINYILMSRIISKLYASDLGDLIGDKVMTGDITLYMIKPTQPMISLAMQNLGENLFQMLRISCPLYIISVVVFKLKTPSITIWLAFVLSVLLSYLLFTIISLFIGILSFYIQGIRGVNLLKIIIISFFSGAFIPIDLFPTYLINIAKFLPFQGMYYLPLQIFLGKISFQTIYGVYFNQLIWIISLLILSLIIWYKGKEHLIVKGG
jgi:ABC-2 type transport system permease protein